MDTENTMRITQTMATIAELMGFSVTEQADVANETVLQAAKEKFSGQKVQKALLYNPDAIALWLYQKYTHEFAPVIAQSQMALPVRSVMPSVTPVCFASMYTGLVPAEHGIQAYVKPVLTVETLFDAALRAGLRPVIISTEGDSITKIFLEREMDYIVCQSAEECNEQAKRVLQEEDYDLIVVYNGNFDATMHRNGPEAEASLEALRHNSRSYAELTRLARQVWKGKRSVTAYLPDHGCHEIDGDLGSHGLDMAEDMNIIHFYAFWGEE